MLWVLISRFRWRVAGTTALVLAEAVTDLLFPLFIGIAINGLLRDEYTGLMALGGLGLVALLIGSARRFFDTRAYTGIYEQVATEMVTRQRQDGASTSTITARTNLLTEFIEFLENYMPQIINTVVATTGILVIVGAINLDVMWACLALLVLIAGTYLATGRLNFRFHAGYNDELERQVDAVAASDTGVVRSHFRALMRWNRRLSDLETANYFVVWLGVIALLLYAPVAIIEPGETEYGFAFSAIIYVFQYVEALVALPLFIQQLIRLQEISSRLTGD